MRKKLIRSQNRVFAGVCGGIADWLDLDPSVVRIAYLLLSLFSAGFPGLLIYVILWIIIPENYVIY